MSTTGKQFKKEIEHVLNVDLVDIAEENILLLAAMLYGSDPMETRKIFDNYVDDSPEMKAARICLALHSDAEFRYRACLLEFFADSVKAMLNIALENPLYGARMMPIFCTYATYAEDHAINDELKGALVEVMEHLRATFGFAITEFTSEGGEIILADELSDIDTASERGGENDGN